MNPLRKNLDTPRDQAFAILSTVALSLGYRLDAATFTPLSEDEKDALAPEPKPPNVAGLELNLGLGEVEMKVTRKKG
jgi:hypothetical protein